MRRCIILLFFLLSGCGHQKVLERNQKKILRRVAEIEDYYNQELKIADEYCLADRSQRKVLMESLSELIMLRGEPYHANYELMMFDPYRAYPFLFVSEDLDGKMKFLRRRVRFFDNDEESQGRVKELIGRLNNLSKLIFIYPQYAKERHRYQKYRLIESAADFACHEIADLKDQALQHERIAF